jgi:hypothetical protein
LTDANAPDEGFEGEARHKHGEPTYKVNFFALIPEPEAEVVSHKLFSYVFTACMLFVAALKASI